MKAIDRKGLIWFLGICFSATYAVEFMMYLKGYTFMNPPAASASLIVAVVMFFPGISSLIVRTLITKEGFADAGLNRGNWRYYLQPYLLIPLSFLVIYAITAWLVQPPDFSLVKVMKEYGLPPLKAPAFHILLAVVTATLTVAPFLNAIPGFGEELGWRGYLLPKLLPLGRTKALLVSGFIWGLWHAPLVLMGFHYGRHGLLGVVFFTLLIMVIGVYFGYLRLASGSVWVPAFAHGVFNAQSYGVWSIIFPGLNPFIGGIFGLIGIAVWGFVCLGILHVTSRRR